MDFSLPTDGDGLTLIHGTFRCDPSCTARIYRLRIIFRPEALGGAYCMLPEGARIMQFQDSYESGIVVALGEPSRPLVEHRFAIFESGQDIQIDKSIGRYLGTFIQGTHDYYVFLRC